MLVDLYNLANWLARAFGNGEPEYWSNRFDLVRLAQMVVTKWRLPSISEIHVFFGSLPDPDATTTFPCTRNYALRNVQSQADAGSLILHKQRTRPDSDFECPYCQVECAVCFNGHVVCDKRPKEKGVDVALAIEGLEAGLMRGVRHILVFSQDNDLAPMVDRLKEYHSENRSIPWRIAGAYPRPSSKNIGSRPLRGTTPADFTFGEYAKTALEWRRK